MCLEHHTGVIVWNSKDKKHLSGSTKACRLLSHHVCSVCQGAMFPAMHAMLGQWIPPLERSKLCAVTYTGTLIGNVVTMPLSGLLCEHGFDDGWGSVFYVIGEFVIVIILHIFI